MNLKLQADQRISVDPAAFLELAWSHSLELSTKYQDFPSNMCQIVSPGPPTIDKPSVPPGTDVVEIRFFSYPFDSEFGKFSDLEDKKHYYHTRVPAGTIVATKQANGETILGVYAIDYDWNVLERRWAGLLKYLEAHSVLLQNDNDAVAEPPSPFPTW